MNVFHASKNFTLKRLITYEVLHTRTFVIENMNNIVSEGAYWFKIIMSFPFKMELKNFSSEYLILFPTTSQSQAFKTYIKGKNQTCCIGFIHALYDIIKFKPISSSRNNLKSCVLRSCLIDLSKDI